MAKAQINGLSLRPAPTSTDLNHSALVVYDAPAPRLRLIKFTIAKALPAIETTMRPTTT